MRYRNIILWILLIGVLMIVTGCNYQNELGNLTVVTGFFLEKTPYGYQLIADCIDFSEQENKSAVKTKPIIVTATSLSDGFSKLNKQSQSPLYFHRAKVFLLGKTFSDEDANKIGKELFSNQLVRSDIALLKTEISADEVCQTPYHAFGLQLDEQIKKDEFSQQTKLYLLIKRPEKFREIPTVLLSTNGFYLQNK